MNNYNIKYSSMDQFFSIIVSRTDEWYRQLDSWRKSYMELINMNTFRGSSALAAKSYLSEVHEVLLQSIYIAIARFQADFLLYKDQYHNIESNIYASMSRSTIKSVENRISKEIAYLNNIAADIDRSLNSVADIYRLGRPYKYSLEGNLLREKKALSKLNADIEDYESRKSLAARSELRDLLESLKNTIVSLGNSTSVVSYKSGDIINKKGVVDLCRKVQFSSEYIEKNQKAIDRAAMHQQEIFEQMQKDYEEACKAREDEGRVKLITGIAAAVAGVAAIVVTAGAATPIVVTAAVAGTCSTAYGISNMVEGGQDIYYGSIGDLNTKAFNPIRDTIFMGNQGAYDIWGNINMTVAGLCIPVSQAVNGVAGASNTVLVKTAAKTIVKETIVGAGTDFASNNISKFAADKLNLNKTETTILNMVIKAGIDKGVDFAETKFTGKTPSYVEGMSYEDAKRYNQYWENVEAGKNTGYSGLTDADLKAWSYADGKVNEHIAMSKVDTDAVLELRLESLKQQNSLSAADVSSGTQAGSIGSNNAGIKTYKPVEYQGSVKVDGELRDVSRKVYQRNDIDINYFDKTTGMTNLERMREGNPPIGPDGNPIQLHHVLQSEPGPIAEITETAHHKYHSQLHGLVEDNASFRNNPTLNKQYNNFRRSYWIWRAEQITGGK